MSSSPPASRSIARTAALLLPVQVVLRAGEALLPLLLAAWFGRSDAMDIYYFAWAVFALAGSLVFSAYQDSSIVPILAEVKLASGRGPELGRVLGSLLANTLVFGGALAALVGLLAWAWFGVRYAGEDLVLATRMVPILAAYLVALSVKTFFGAVLNSEHRYFVAPVAGAAGVITSVGLIAGGRGVLGVLAIPVGLLAGEVVAAACLAATATLGLGLRLSLTLERPEPVRRFVRLASAQVGGGAVARVNPVIDQLMAGLTLVAGGGTLLRLSGDVSSLPTSLLQASLLPVLLTHLSEDFANRRHDQLERRVRRALVVVLAILVAVSGVLFLVREPLLRAVFLRGEMDAVGVARMTEIFVYHLVGVAPFGALLVLARAHVATHNTGIMLGMGALNAGCNVVFNAALLRPLGLCGLALSTSLVHTVVAVVFWFRFKAHLKRLQGAEPGGPS